MDEYDDMTTDDVAGLPAGWSAWVYSVAWNNPYRQPPEGLPRHLYEAIVTAPKGRACPNAPPDVDAILHELGLGSGWIKSVAFLPRPIVHWSPERTFKYRRGRLEARIRKKYPLFADTFIAQSLERKPEYYGINQGAAT